MHYEHAKANPSTAFAFPEDVLKADTLTREQKVDVLRQWEYDAREMEVAEEENMAGGPDDILPRILAALESLHPPPSAHGHPSNKQGGE